MRNGCSSITILASHKFNGVSNGRWLMVSERRTEDGGTICIYSDITELKQREQDLTESLMLCPLYRLSWQDTYHLRYTIPSLPANRTSRLSVNARS